MALGSRVKGPGKNSRGNAWEIFAHARGFEFEDPKIAGPFILGAFLMNPLNVLCASSR